MSSPSLRRCVPLGWLAGLLLLAGCVATGGEPGPADTAADQAAADTGLAGLWGGALDPAGPPGSVRAYLVAASEAQRSVLFFDADRHRLVSRARLDFAPGEMAASPDGRQIYVASESGDSYGPPGIVVLSARDRSVVDRFDLYPYGRFHGLAATRSGTYLYVASEQQRAVLEVNLLSRQVERRFPLAQGSPHLLALDPTETRLYVTDSLGPYVYAVNLASGEVQRARVGEGPEAVAVSPDGLTAWVVNRDDGTVSVLDLFTLAPRITFQVGRAPVRLAFTPDGQRALIVAAGEAALAIYDVAGYARLASVPVGSYPLGLAIDGDGRRAYVLSTRSDEVTVVDLAGRTSAGSFPVGLRSTTLLWVGAR